MTNHDYDQQLWEACPTGELRALADRLESRRRRGRLVKASQLGTLCLLLVGAGVVAGNLVMDKPDTAQHASPPGGITCKECLAYFEAYHLHLVGQQPMDAQLVERMTAHFAGCPKCRIAFEKQFPGELIVQLATNLGPVLAGVGHYPAATVEQLLALL